MHLDPESGCGKNGVMARLKELEPYLLLDDTAIHERIVAAKRALGDRLIILGHHYQRDDIIEHADVTGDSYKLARLGAERTGAKFVVFCGVHFMAESADILRAPHQTVILPDLNAGCSMADMAPTEDVLDAGAALERLGVHDVTPITYMNSTAELKAFCGERGGAVCTSSNARGIFEWAFRQKEKIFFFPDEHLGRNTAIAMGIPAERIQVWDPKREQGGLTAAQIDAAEPKIRSSVQSSVLPSPDLLDPIARTNSSSSRQPSHVAMCSSKRASSCGTSAPLAHGSIRSLASAQSMRRLSRHPGAPASGMGSGAVALARTGAIGFKRRNLEAKGGDREAGRRCNRESGSAVTRSSPEGWPLRPGKLPGMRCRRHSPPRR